MLKKQEVKSAIDEILSVSKKEKLLAILEVLPLEGDRNINTSDVLKVRIHWKWPLGNRRREFHKLEIIFIYNLFYFGQRK